MSEYNGTPFSAIYNRFLGKITDDMYMELTPEDTVRDLQRLIIDAIPGFEFPRKDLYDYNLLIQKKSEEEIDTSDFVIGVSWDEIPADEINPPRVLVDKSCFSANLTSEEINILALLMMNSWLQRQITSIENIRMKYSGSDFKFTSQANHLSKLLSLQTETQRQSFHMQRLYKRRKLDDNGIYRSTWGMFRNGVGHSTWVSKSSLDETTSTDASQKEKVTKEGVVESCDCDDDSCREYWQEIIETGATNSSQCNNEGCREAWEELSE